MMILGQSIAIGGSPFDEKAEFWQHVESMVRAGTRRDRNHPSIVLWSRSNEVVQCSANWRHMAAMLRKMQLVSREEDPTRYVYESGSGALDGRGEIISLHYPHEVYYGGGFSELPQSAYWLEDAKQVRSLYLQYDEKTGGRPVALTEAHHVYFAGGPESMYFWMGEDVYDCFLRGGQHGDGFGRFRDAVEDVTAESFLGLRAGGAAIVATTGAFHIASGGVDCRMAKALAPVLAYPRQRDHRFFEGDKVTRTFDVHNDLLAGPCEVVFRWSGSIRDSAYYGDGDATTRPGQIMIPQHGEARMTLAGGERRKVAVDFVARSTSWGRNFLDCHAGPVPYGLHVQVLVNGEIRFAEKYDFSVYKREFPTVALGAPVTLLEPAGGPSPSGQALEKLGVRCRRVEDLAALKYPETGILVVAKNALAKLDKTQLQAKMAQFTAAGGWVVCLEQDDFPTGCFTVDLRADTNERSRRATMVQPIDAGHPVLEGLTAEDFRYWRGDHYVTRQNLVKPAEGNFRPILAYGNSTTPVADRTSLVEVFHGRGGYLVSQMVLVEKLDTEPVAPRLLANMLNYARRRQVQDAEFLRRKLALVAPVSEAGKKDWLESLGAEVDVLTPKAVQDLAAYKVAVVVLAKGFPAAGEMGVLQQWVRQGGKLLVLGLTPQTAAEGASLCGATAALVNPKSMSNNLVVKRRSDELTLGLSNADLCWEKPLVARPPLVRLQGPTVSDLTEDPLLEKVVAGGGLMAVCQFPLPAEKDLDLARRAASILLTNLGVGLASDVDAASNVEEAFFPVDMRKACNMGFKDDVAGDHKGGWTDQGANDMRYFPVGPQVLGGVKFDVIDPARNDGKSCIVLKGKPCPYFPAQSNEIPVGGLRLDKLYFLHAVEGATGGRQASYIVHYSDGAYVEVPVRLGSEVQGWSSPPANLPNAKVAWSGKNDVCPNLVSVYTTAWQNLHPNNSIDSVKMVTGGEDGVPILIAVTGAKAGKAAARAAGNTIHVDASELKPNADGTWSYHDGYAPDADLQDDHGDELPGGPAYARFWRRLFAVDSLHVTWSYRGHLSYLSKVPSDVRSQQASFTMKYVLPPDKLIDGGELKCRFDHWRCEGCVAAVQVSPDNENWVEIFRFTSGKEPHHWTPENSRTGPGEEGKSCKATSALPRQGKGWQTLYVRCLVDQGKAWQGGGTDHIQMLREDWFEKDEHYSLDLTLRAK
jgi:beta-galactosidase